MLDELCALAETYVISSFGNKQTPKALLIITDKQQLISIHLGGQKIGRRDSLNYYRWLNARLGAVAYAYITSVVAVDDGADAKPRPEILVHVSTARQARQLNFPLKRDARDWRSFVGEKRVSDIHGDRVSEALYYFFKPPQMNLLKGFRFGREFGRLLKSEALRDWWKRDPIYWEGITLLPRRTGQRSSDEPLIFSGDTPGERLEAFARSIGATARDSQAASLMSLAAFNRIEYLAPRPLSEFQKGFAIIALTDSFSQWFNVDWDETMLMCFSTMNVAELLSGGEPTRASMERAIRKTRRIHERCGDLHNTFPELAQLIGQAAKDAIIRSNEDKLQEAARTLVRTMLF